MAEASNFAASSVCGLYELDTNGTILYSRPKSTGKIEKADAETNGRNFFDDFFIGQNSEALRYRFQRFVKEGNSTENFKFDFVRSDETFPLKIMLVRAADTGGAENKDLIFLEVRQF